MTPSLDFEKPVVELQSRIEQLKPLAGAPNIAAEINKIEERANRLLRDTYARLTPWQKTQVARHPERPHFTDLAEALLSDFTPLAGDRRFGEDAAIIGGPAFFRDRPVMVIGHEKGRDTQARVHHNFGMARPEGYRKAARLIDLADRMGLPIITLVDTAGAFPGVQAEERGQAEAIARATEASLNVGVPFVAAIVGEGGSGGAVALATANRVLMFEHAIYSVISPEGCASILWRTRDKAPEAADALRLTAQDLQQLGVIDAVVPEPPGAAHRDRAAAAKRLGEAIAAQLGALDAFSPNQLRESRRVKFLEMGQRGL